MSEIEYIKVKVRDLFIPKGGSNRYTKEFIKNNSGIYPIYSSNTGEMFGTCNEFQYDGEYLTWSLVGCAGYILKLDGKFSITNNRGILLLKDNVNNVVLEYVKYLMEPLFRKYKTGREGDLGKNEYTKLSPTAITNIEDEILMPIDSDGKYDVTVQNELAKKYYDIEMQKKELIEHTEELATIQITIPKDNSCLWKEVSPIELFSPKGGNMAYSKAWAKENPGNYPLYSGTTSGSYDRVNTAEYDGEYLSWCIDGLAGYMMYHNEAFSVTCHRGVLEPKEDIDFTNIDLKYIKYVLEPTFRKRKKGREGDLGKNEYTSLKPIAIKKMKDTFPMPIKEDGSFDLAKQKELASKYEQIEAIKTGLIRKILEITDIVIL